jgi:putative GTP pyrophosphokinase
MYFFLICVIIKKPARKEDKMEIFNDYDEFNHLMLKYDFALEKLKTELNILIKEYEFNNQYQPVDHIKSRIKTKESAIKKLEKKGYDINLQSLSSHIHDMVGIRIICSFLSDVYDIVNIIEKSQNLKIKEKRDYIKNPKKSGYSSYHLIVQVPIYLNDEVEYIDAEIQIRTMAMDFWASLDHKIQYKYNEIPEEVKEEMYNCSLAIKSLDDKMLDLNKRVKQKKKTVK